MVSPDQLREDYDRQYQDKGIHDSDSFYRWALDLLEVEAPGQILDVSCGEGHLLRWALKRQVSAFGLDIANEAARISRDTAPGAMVVTGNGERLPFADQSFEYVTNLGSMEHYWHPEDGVREVARVLRKDGKACLLMPNTFFVVDLIWRVWRTGYGPSHTQAIERFAARNEWRDFIEAHGLQVYRVVKYNSVYPRSRKDVRWFLTRPKRLLSLLISPLTPTNFSFAFAYLCRPAT